MATAHDGGKEGREHTEAMADSDGSSCTGTDVEAVAGKEGDGCGDGARGEKEAMCVPKARGRGCWGVGRRTSTISGRFCGDTVATTPSFLSVCPPHARALSVGFFPDGTYVGLLWYK